MRDRDKLGAEAVEGPQLREDPRSRGHGVKRQPEKPHVVAIWARNPDLVHLVLLGPSAMEKPALNSAIA